MNKIIYPITIVIACLILGGSYYLVQINKQNSIEQQKEKETSVKQAGKVEKEQKLQDCLDLAHQRFVDEGIVECNQRGYSEEDFDNLKCFLDTIVLTRLEQKQRDEQEFCLKLYK